MRLKTIKLSGFKSFVDPTQVHFPSNMCAVVGPNGCGKSNVIDAVRWVMGESSAKNLRGESMTDVIFNGSVNRQPVGQASIELVFDNQDGSVGGEYASYAEISIKRQVTREGQSEYFLNGTRCRRRDITDIFLGTGLGPRSYAIIEQGMISRLIESKPEELRVFIEEAAGISKYKERRKETESRMRRTLENLERLTDLRDELERQLQHLQRQSQAAEKYSEFKQEERALKSQLQALQWQSLDGRIGTARHDIGELDIKLESVVAEHRQVDARIEELRVNHTEASDTFNEVQARYYSIGSEVARIEQTIKHQQERSRQLTEDLVQTEDSFKQAEQHLEDDGAKQSQWEQELAAVTPELSRLQAAEQQSSDSLLQAEDVMQSWQQEWDDFNQHAAKPRQQAEVQQSRIQHLEQALQRIQQRISSLEQEKESLSAGPADQLCEQLGEKIAAQELAMAAQQNRGDELLQQVNAARDRRNQLSTSLDEARGVLQGMRGRQASLEALQQGRAGAGEAVESWLDQQQLSARPRLLEQIQVEPEWQNAVETVLGDNLRAVCVERIEQFASALEQSPRGQMMLMDASAQQAATGLATKVSGVANVQGLLGAVQVAENLADALQRRSTLEAHQSLITRDGIWVGADWVRVNNLAEEEGGVIARQQELEQLAGEMSVAEQHCAELETELAQLGETLKQMEQQRHDAQAQLQSVTREHAEMAAELSAEQAKIEQISKRRDGVNREIDESRSQFQAEQEGLAEARQLLSAAIESMEQDSKQRETLLSQRDAARTQLDEARQAARHDKDAAHQTAMQHQSLQAQLQSMIQSIERTSDQVRRLIERKQSLQENIQSNDAPLEGLQEDLKTQLQQRLLVESELGEARDKVASIDGELRSAEGERASIEQRSEAVRGQLEKLKLENQTLQVQRETLEKALLESEHELEAVLAGLPEEAEEAEWQRRLEQVGNRITRLGPINLAAIDEYTQQSERKNYLDAQNEDLETALQTLESAIRKIDKETRNRFRETFDQVNASLQELFPRVFGGGSAYLEMTGEDLLDTGITIMARPPGKKNATIHLLSGGEKALTAIALVFSIFRLNPAPFCMLDEVDAPLDDANTSRYARMVKEMSEHVQFIFITHNKITMEMADHLMGVTMQEPGVSRLVTVDVEAAAELAAV
ncbi:MAG: chromosome segregation protein SMC [Halieaceae bacterium]